MERDKATAAREKVLAILGEANGAAARAKTPPSGHSAVGNNNVVGNGNTIVIAHQVVEKPIVVAKPGAEHITQEEARSIKDLVDLIVALEKATRDSPLGYQAVWNELTKAVNVTRYLLIPRARYGEAKAFLEAWVERLRHARLMKTDSPVEEARRNHTAYIIGTVESRGWRVLWGAWFAREFGGRSLDQLNSDELWLAYQRVATMAAADEPGRAL